MLSFFAWEFYSVCLFGIRRDPPVLRWVTMFSTFQKKKIIYWIEGGRKHLISPIFWFLTRKEVADWVLDWDSARKWRTELRQTWKIPNSVKERAKWGEVQLKTRAFISVQCSWGRHRAARSTLRCTCTGKGAGWWGSGESSAHDATTADVSVTPIGGSWRRMAEFFFVQTWLGQHVLTLMNGIYSLRQFFLESHQ